MKLSHNKKRNTALIYEILIKELTKAVLREDTTKKNMIVSLLKESFGKGKSLGKEKDIYDSFTGVEGFSRETLEKLIIEAKKQFSSLDRKDIFNQQTKLINKMNKSLTRSVWKNFVPSFKKLATINQLLQENLSPKKQVLLEKKFLDTFLVEQKDKNKFPKINNLAMKNFVEKFNQEYSTKLNESQRDLLNKYITSYMDNGLEFKEDNSFEEESNELQEVLDQMLGPQDDLDPVKDMKYSKPTVETGSELKAQKDKKDLPEMSPLPEPKGLMATPSDSHKSIPKGTFIEPKAYSDKISKRKVVPVDVSYAPLIEEFTHRLADIEQRRKIGNKMLGDRL